MTARAGTGLLTVFDAAVATRPDDVAIHRGRRAVTYGELGRRVDEFASALWRKGLRPGTTASLMIRPGPDLVAMYLAMARVGVTVVVLDPRKGLRAGLREAAPDAFVGEPLARVLFGLTRRATTVLVHKKRKKTDKERPGVLDDPDAVTSVLYTSGSTGPAKGVVFRARQTRAQFGMTRDILPSGPGEVVLSGFPPFAMSALINGGRLVLPDMGLRHRPAHVDPVRIVADIERHGVTSLFGSPAFLDVVARYACHENITFTGLKVVTSAGATLDPCVAERLRACLPGHTLLYSAYGATECLPISVIESRELLGEARRMSERGAGSCVGTPRPELTVRVIRIGDEPIPEWDDGLLVSAGVVGEITVAGPVVSESYLNRPHATELAKIREGDRIVHRVGDLGWFDTQGRLWFCGRKSQRVGELCTEQVEPIVNTVPGVLRSALVDGPAVCLELDGTRPRSAVVSDVHDLLQQFDHTRELTKVLCHRRFPVDVRHNSKIVRERLARWAATKKGD